jgi:hypothetical protein
MKSLRKEKERKVASKEKKRKASQGPREEERCFSAVDSVIQTREDAFLCSRTRVRSPDKTDGSDTLNICT